MLEDKVDTSTWYLKHLAVTVNELSLRYHFDVDKWLTKNRFEGKKEFEFAPTSVERLFRGNCFILIKLDVTDVK